jgi:pimeloyl-ACP methyl ester carboxylesterase
MATTQYPLPVTEGYVEANGLKICYVEAGRGIPLLLLHGGIVSNGPVWADSQYGWGSHLGRFAEHFRVIAPDTRGHGRTLNPTGVLTFPDFAADVIALSQALQFEKPVICGFSDGGITATLVGIVAPELPRAIVNLAGLDMFDPDPDSPSRVMNRIWLGGDPHATKTKVGGPDLPSAMIQKVIEDFEPTQGPGYVKRYFDQLFDLWILPTAYTIADLPKIAAPILILVGDRESGLPVEEATAAYRKLPRGEMGVIPGTEHGIAPLACTVALDFLLRQRGPASKPQLESSTASSSPSDGATTAIATSESATASVAGSQGTRRRRLWHRRDQR